MNIRSIYICWRLEDVESVSSLYLKCVFCRLQEEVVSLYLKCVYCMLREDVGGFVFLKCMFIFSSMFKVYLKFLLNICLKCMLIVWSVLNVWEYMFEVNVWGCMFWSECLRMYVLNWMFEDLCLKLNVIHSQFEDVCLRICVWNWMNVIHSQFEDVCLRICVWNWIFEDVCFSCKFFNIKK